MHKRFVILGCALLTGALTSISRAELAEHVDISPYVDAGQIVTGGYDDANSKFLPGPFQVFGYDFQEDPFDPYFSDPGFNAPAGSGLPAGSKLSFNVLSGGDFGLPGNLTYWDGTGDVAFNAVPAGESLLFNLGSQNVLVSSATGFQSGLSLGTIAGDGFVHKHLNSFLNGSGGNDPTDGIYLLALELTAVGADTSDPFFLVFNNGLSEEAHDLAIDWVQTHLVPEPSGVALATIGGLVLAMLFTSRRHTVRRG